MLSSLPSQQRVGAFLSLQELSFPLPFFPVPLPCLQSPKWLTECCLQPCRQYSSNLFVLAWWITHWILLQHGSSLLCQEQTAGTGHKEQELWLSS